MQRKATTRQELLLAGRRLFSEKGLYESRVEDLTRTAGVAKGTLYLYFRDKEDLIGAVVTSGFQMLQQRVRERTNGVRSLDALVSRICVAHFEFFDENPDLMRIFHQARGMLKFDRPRWRPLRLPLVQHLEGLAEILAQAPSMAHRSRSQRLDVAIQLLGAVSGVISVRTAAQHVGPLDSDARDLSRGLLAACSPARARTSKRAARQPRSRPSLESS